MKRYALFGGRVYYPTGGWGDFRASFDTEAEALARVERIFHESWDWWEVIDLTTGQRLHKSDR